MISPLVVGFPLLSSITAASQETGGGSDGSAALPRCRHCRNSERFLRSRRNAVFGAATYICTRFGFRREATAGTQLASRGKPVTQDIAEPYASLTADPNGGQGSDFAALAPVSDLHSRSTDPFRAVQGIFLRSAVGASERRFRTRPGGRGCSWSCFCGGKCTGCWRKHSR